MHGVFITSKPGDKHAYIRGASKDACCTSPLGGFSDFILPKHSFSYLRSCRSPLVELPRGCHIEVLK